MFSYISFNLLGLEGNIGTELIFSSMVAWSQTDITSGNITLTSIIGNFSLFPNSSTEIKTGIGFSPAIVEDYLTFSALSIPFDINYYLPINFSGLSKFKVALNLHVQRTLANGVSDKWFGVNDRSIGYVQLGILIQFYQSFFD